MHAAWQVPDKASLMPQADLLSGLLHSRWLLCLVAEAPGGFSRLIVCLHRCGASISCERACLVHRYTKCFYGVLQGTSAGCGTASFPWMQPIL